MNSKIDIGLIGSYGGHPLDIILPIICEDDFNKKTENSGHCFHIYSINYTKLSLFSINPDGIRRTAQLDIRKSCKENGDISISIVKMNDDTLYLRAYMDSIHNGLYPIPLQLTD